MSKTINWPGFSTFQHLRLAFSIFLLPVFLFALSQADEVDRFSAWLSFFIWHFLVYPASNGYNSYFDKDKGSIALIENPLPVDKSLYYVSLLLDSAAIILAFFVGLEMVIGVLVYGLFSKLYSHPSIRLKKYPFLSFFVVFIFQGGFVYMVTSLVISDLSFASLFESRNLLPALLCSLLIGASYPLTQVYQHAEDSERGDRTLSLVLGIKGSFHFAAIMFFLALLICWIYWNELGVLKNFALFAAFLLPVAWSFVSWYRKVLNDPVQANHRNMSNMTLLSSVMMLFYFGLLNFI